ETERRAGILIGPEFGTLSRVDLTAAAREANDARFDVLIACAFNFDAHSSELSKLGPLPILKAKMNPDLHMADDLKNTGKGNLFVVFGEPDIDIRHLDGSMIEVQVTGRLKSPRGRPTKAKSLFKAIGEKIPFTFLADVRRHLEDEDISRKGVYIAHDSMGYPRYIGRGDIFNRLDARRKSQVLELSY